MAFLNFPLTTSPSSLTFPPKGGEKMNGFSHGVTKKFILALILILVFASSFVAGLLITEASAGRCTVFCDPDTCFLTKCCDGVCRPLHKCSGVRWAIICR